MTDFRERYKRVGIGRENMAANRALRSQRRDEARRDARTEHFSLRRDIEDDGQHEEDDNNLEEEKRKDEMIDNEDKKNTKADEDLDNRVHKRWLQLQKWKQERNERRLQEKKRMKPAFKVGVVHHRVYSPPVKKDPVSPPSAKLCRSKEIHHHNPEPPPKRVTRATEKRLAVKAANSKQKQEDQKTEIKDKGKVQSKVKPQIKEQVPLAPDNFQFKAPLGVTAIPMFGRQMLEPSKNGQQLVSTSSSTSFSVQDQEMYESEKEINMVEEMDTDKLHGEQMVEENNVKPSHNDSVDSKQKKRTINRRSTRIESKDSNFMLEDQENINYNTRNLMDYSISDLGKISSPKRKSMRFTEDLENKSFMKFSPRRSMRPQTGNSPKQVDNQFIQKSTIEDESLTHNNSEPTNQIMSKKNDVLNQSLNMSLPKESTPDKPPAFFSPYVVTSRGKDRVRKEVQRRRFNQLPPADIPTKDNIMQKLNISIEEEERTSQYYRFILDKEIERLNEMCDIWNVIKEDPATPEDIHYEIQAAVGQTQLLIRKKFERFRSLVLDCESGKGEMLVTCKDLQGFWEMMYMEIRDCDNRFNKLDAIKAKNWVIEESEEEQKEKITKKKTVAKKSAAKKKTVAAKSSLRAHIMAARKKKMAKDNDVIMDTNETPILEENDRLQEIVETVPEGASSPPKNTRRSMSTPKSNNKWQSLLKKVQLSQTRKSTTSPLIVMKLSQMCKTPEVQLDESIVYINSDRTPAKGILKLAKEELMGSVAKSTNKVFFKEQPIEFRKFETNSGDMSFENVDEFKEPIERRLNFDNDSLNLSHLDDDNDKGKEETEKTNDSLIKLSPLNVNAEKKQLSISKIVIDEIGPLISMSPLSLHDTKEKSPIKKNVKTKKAISFKDDSNGTPTHSLRSRKLLAPDTPRPKSKNFEPDVENMDVDSHSQDNSEYSPANALQKSRQLYMNEEGIICERIVDVQDTPRTSLLKRANSEATRRITRSSEIKDLEVKALSNPKLERKYLSNVDTKLVEDDANTTDQDEETPKLVKRTPKARKTMKGNNLDSEESTQKPTRSKITRSESLNTGVESATPRGKRTNSRLNKTQSSLDDSLVEVSTPSLKRKLSKSTQVSLKSDEQEIDEGVGNDNKVSRKSSIKRRNTNSTQVSLKSDEQEIDEGVGNDNKVSRKSSIKRRNTNSTQVSLKSDEQEIDEGVGNDNKVSRKSSIKRRNTKKYLDLDEKGEQNIDISKNEVLTTPNTRRKSLRISKSTKGED